MSLDDAFVIDRVEGGAVKVNPPVAGGTTSVPKDCLTVTDFSVLPNANADETGVLLPTNTKQPALMLPEITALVLSFATLSSFLD